MRVGFGLPIMLVLTLTPLAGQNFHATLDGYSEVPAISTPGKGAFRATLSADGASLTYQLEYVGLKAPATAAHVHFGKPGTAGGVMFFLCGGDGKPACPGLGGSVSGTVVAANILGPAAQGISPGDLAAALAAMRAGAAYVNVHSTMFPAGEIRGEIEPGPGPGAGQGRQKVKVCQTFHGGHTGTTIEVAVPSLTAHLKHGSCLAKPTDEVGRPCTCP